MTTTFAYDERIGECIVEIFMSGQPNSFGFFVAPNKLLTCAHVIYAGDVPCKIASNSEIRWSGQSLPTQITGIDRGKDEDLAMLSVELIDHYHCLPLNVDVVSFEALHLHVNRHMPLTVFNEHGSDTNWERNPNLSSVTL